MSETKNDGSAVKTISIKTELNPGKISYDKVIIKGEGYFLITGDTELEIGTLINNKDVSKSKYEFLIQTKDRRAGGTGECSGDASEGAKVSINIHTLINNVSLKSMGGNGGKGGNGSDGGPGGDGGNAAGPGGYGGKGGNGGDGAPGSDGGDGAPAPDVTVVYSPAIKDIHFSILSKDNMPSEEKLSYGGQGGQGGQGGKGGSGGRGGLNGDKETRAPQGESGNDGKRGNDGRDGEDKPVNITRVNY